MSRTVLFFSVLVGKNLPTMESQILEIKNIFDKKWFFAIVSFNKKN